MALSSVHPPFTRIFIRLFRQWQHRRAAGLTEGKVKVMCLSKQDLQWRGGRGGAREKMCAHAKRLRMKAWARPRVKLLDDQVGEMWFKFTQSPTSFPFKAAGLAGYTTAGTTVREQSSKWLSLPRLTYIWPWQTNPNTENRTYVKTICRRRKAGCGGRASLHLVTDTAVWRETSANMLIHKACRRVARPALLCSPLWRCGCRASAVVRVHP